jgi:hypothetical protein
MQHDIIDNRESYLGDAVRPLLTQSERAHFAVGFFFLSGFKSIAKELEHVKELRLLIGKPDDWHRLLSPLFGDGVTVGVICEVKTGKYQPKRLFPVANVRYALHRMGLVLDVPRVALSLSQKAVVDPSPNVRIAQLLISRSGKPGENYLAVIIYMSALEEGGQNVVVFDPDAVAIDSKVELVEVTGIAITFQPVQGVLALLAARSDNVLEERQ